MNIIGTISIWWKSTVRQHTTILKQKCPSSSSTVISEQFFSIITKALCYILCCISYFWQTREFSPDVWPCCSQKCDLTDCGVNTFVDWQWLCWRKKGTSVLRLLYAALLLISIRWILSQWYSSKCIFWKLWRKPSLRMLHPQESHTKETRTILVWFSRHSENLPSILGKHEGHIKLLEVQGTL